MSSRFTDLIDIVTTVFLRLGSAVLAAYYLPRACIPSHINCSRFHTPQLRVSSILVSTLVFWSPVDPL